MVNKGMLRDAVTEQLVVKFVVFLSLSLSRCCPSRFHLVGQQRRLGLGLVLELMIISDSALTTGQVTTD